MNTLATSKVSEAADGSLEQVGNDTDCALLSFGHSIGIDSQQTRVSESARFFQCFPFSQTTKRSTTILKMTESTTALRLYCTVYILLLSFFFNIISYKGAADLVLSKCKKAYIGEAEEAISDAKKHAIANFITENSTLGFNRLLTLFFHIFV